MRSLDQSMYQEWVLRHSNDLSPQDLLYFTYLDEFQDDWKDVFPGDDDEMSLWALEVLIMAKPDGAPVVPGTGGLRKLRFGTQETGKRGGARILYCYFQEHFLVLMIAAYKKGRKDNLSESEKAGIKQYLESVQDWLDREGKKHKNHEKGN